MSDKKNKIVFDLETQKEFKEVGGKQNLAELKISVVGAYDYATDTLRGYLENEIEEFEKLLKDSVVIGYNIRQFDFPVLKPYLKNTDIDSVEMIDIMEELQNILGYRISLDSVAEATLGIKKSGHGLQAVEYYRRGEIDKIVSYCLDDVKITRDIYEFAKKNGYLKFKAGWDIYEVPIKMK